MRISISTLSKSFSLTDEAIRFYERKGLLTPARVNDRGYRVFERVDIQRVGNIKRLKNQGFQLDEIHRIYKGISQAEMLSLMHEKLRELRQEIRYKDLIAKRMEASIECCKRFAKIGSTPTLSQQLPVYARLYPSIEALWDNVHGSNVLKKLFCHLPLSSFTTVIPRSALQCEIDPETIQKGVLIGKAGADVLGIDVTSGFRRIDASAVVSCVLQLENGQFELSDYAPSLLDFIKTHKLHPADDLFTHQIMNFNDPNGDNQHYTELVLPVLQG